MQMAANTLEQSSDNFAKQIDVARVELKTHFSTLIDKLRQREAQLINVLNAIERDYYQNDKEIVESFKKIMSGRGAAMSNEWSKQLEYDAKAKVKSVKFVCSSEWGKQISSMGHIAVNRDTISINYNNRVIPQISVCGRAKEGQVAKTHLYSGVAIDPNTNNIYLADYSNSSVSVYNDTGVYMFEFGSDNNDIVKNDYKMNGPTCIAYYNETLFISQTRSHCILVYKMDGTLINKFGSYGSDYEQLNNPCGLAISIFSGDIFVCDSNNNRVAVFNSNFKHRTSLSYTNIEIGRYVDSELIIDYKPLNIPLDIKLSINEIFVLDSNEKCVHVFNYSWKCIKSLITFREINIFFISSGDFLLVDKDDNIIISNRGTNSVKIFTKEGKLFHQIGGSSTDQLSKPGGVAIDNKNRLVIANNKQDGIIQIY